MRRTRRARSQATQPRAVGPTPSTPSSAHRLLRLQPSVGNAAVVQLVAAATAGSARPTVRRGSRGEDVEYLQSRLNRDSRVEQELSVDGIFGRNTQRAVRQLQTADGTLVVDGIVGPRTWPVVESIAEEPTSEDHLPIARKIFRRGARAYDAGDYAHAYDFFTRAHELTPRAGLVFSRAQALRRLGGRREDAIALYEQYLTMPDGTRHSEAAVLLAELRGAPATGDPDVDVAASRPHFERGAAYYDAGEYGHAYDQFTIAYGLAPKAGLVFSRAQALRRLGGRREDAIALYEQYLTMPDGTRHADAAALLAELRGAPATGDPEVDLASSRQHFMRGAAHYDAGEYGHAYDQFTIAYGLTPKAALVFSRAQALRRLGARREDAMALYEQYLAMPDGTRHDDARFALGELRSQGAMP